MAGLPLALSTLIGPAAGVCPQVLPPGKPGLTLDRENVLATLKGGPFSREPLADSWGVGQDVTCGLVMDSVLGLGWS